MTSLYYGFWDYWNLRHKVTFDGVNKLILINEGETIIDIQTDIYSDWKEWVALDNNLKYLPPMNTVGGEPTIEGQRLDVTYFLINGWKLKPYPGSYDLTIIGNIFDANGGTIKVPADIIDDKPNNISITTNTSVIVRQVDSGNSTGGLTLEQNAVLFNIEGNIISIQSLLQSPITASLVPTQAAQLSTIEAKLNEIWQLHGLDSENPLNVTQTSRTFGDVDQSIMTTGSGSAQETTILRN